MKEAINQSLYSYWNGLRGDRIAPKRFEIEPSSIASVLPDTFILERTDRSSLRFRLAGTRICEAFGTELRGASLLELFTKEDKPLLERQIARVTSDGAVAVFEIDARSDNGLSTRFEMLLMPLTHMRDTVDRFLGSFAPIDKPAWLGTVLLTNRKVLAHETLWPDGVPAGRRCQTPFLPALRESRVPRQSESRRRFRVYDGGLNPTRDE